MEIETIVSTGPVNVGLFACEAGHHGIFEAATTTDDAGGTSFNTIPCFQDGCSLSMTCKVAQAVTFSYTNTA